MQKRSGCAFALAIHDHLGESLLITMKFISLTLTAAVLFLSIGLLSPVQADPSPSPADQQATTNTSNVAYIEFKLTAKEADGTVVATDKAISLYLHSNATDGWDFFDASKRIPSLTDQFALLAFTGQKNGENVLKAVESRPYLADSTEVISTRLVRSDLPSDLTYTLSINQWYEVPKGWSVQIESAKLDRPMIFDSPSSSYSFTLKDASNVSSEDTKATSDTTHVPITTKVSPSSSSLPVELTHLSAHGSEDEVLVRWRTASEKNNAGFSIEHRQFDASQTNPWSEIGFVEGEGTTSQPQTYKFTTNRLEHGKHQFRLKQVDIDGTTTTSRVVNLQLRLDASHEVGSPSPNPVRHQSNLKIATQKSQSVRVEIWDAMGRRVRTVFDQRLGDHQTRQIQLNSQGLSSGAYFVQVQGQNFKETRRMVVVE